METLCMHVKFNAKFVVLSMLQITQHKTQIFQCVTSGSVVVYG